MSHIFQGARIVRVIEDVDQSSMMFELSYPIPDGGSDFPQRQFVFWLCSRYLVDEGRGTGEPTIQRVEIRETEPHYMTIRMHTDNGIRELTCSTSVSEVVPPFTGV